MPRRLDDGSPNRYRIVRLKDKLGTRSMASGEIMLEGALAYAVGKLDRGFVQMAEMVNWSRLSNGVKSTALMRRALHDAMTVAHGRVVFGKRIVDQPLARRQLMKMMLPVEQALSLCFMTADALDRAEAGSQDAAALVRILTPVLKFRETRDARKVCGDALEMRGGVGYIEEFAPARLCATRISARSGRAPATSWRSTRSRAQSAAMARTRARGRSACAAERGIGYSANLARPAPRSRRSLNSVRTRRSRPIRRTNSDARRATTTLYHVTSAVMLAWEGARIHERRGDARRMLLSRLVVDHKLNRPDAFTATSGVTPRRWRKCCSATRRCRFRRQRLISVARR